VEGSHPAVDRRGYFRMYIIDIINSMLRCVVSSELVGRDHGTACNIKRQRYDCCMREREREREREAVYTRVHAIPQNLPRFMTEILISLARAHFSCNL